MKAAAFNTCAFAHPLRGSRPLEQALVQRALTRTSGRWATWFVNHYRNERVRGNAHEEKGRPSPLSDKYKCGAIGRVGRQWLRHCRDINHSLPFDCAATASYADSGLNCGGDSSPPLSNL